MKKLFRHLIALTSVALLAACGGGGNEPLKGGGGTGGGATAEYEIAVELQRAGAATTQISSTETVQAVATVKDSGGKAVRGVVVRFSEIGASLLQVSPDAGTALTDASGKAVVDVRATDSAGTGATTLQAAATVGTVAVRGTTAFQVTAGSVDGAALPAAITFIGAAPSDTAIVVKGAGGSGRAESAILTFRVVDASNAPVNGARVQFTMNANSGGATLTPASALTNSGGEVTVTVSSGTQPASVVVTATAADATTVKTQSDSLIVSNDVVLAEGFEIVADKYNLDGRLTGDETSITAFVRDQFGNPVADGLAVNFTTDYGVVATSTLGGCLTVNGTCSVAFKVQNPRGDGLATVVGEVRFGTANVAARQLRINMAGATGTPYLALASVGGEPGPVATQLVLNDTCKKTFELYLSDGNERSTAAGTAIEVPFTSSGASVSVGNGTPVLDQLDGNFTPTLFTLEVDLTGGDLAQPCDPGIGNGTATGDPTYFRIQYTSPGGTVFTQRIDLLYPH